MRNSRGRWALACTVSAACSRPEAAPEADPRADPRALVRPSPEVVERPEVALEARRLAAANRLALAEELLCSYQDASRFPFTSRPIHEHPDQVRPNQPIVERRVMRGRDGARDARLRVRTSQSRVFMAAGESVVFGIAVTDADDHPLAVEVERAVARGLPGERELVPPQVVLAMTRAKSGEMSGVLSPAATAFAGGQTRGAAVPGASALLTRAWLTWDMPTRALLTQALLLARPALTRTLLPGHRTVRAQTTRPRP